MPPRPVVTFNRARSGTKPIPVSTTAPLPITTTMVLPRREQFEVPNENSDEYWKLSLIVASAVVGPIFLGLLIGLVVWLVRVKKQKKVLQSALTRIVLPESGNINSHHGPPGSSVIEMHDLPVPNTSRVARRWNDGHDLITKRWNWEFPSHTPRTMSGQFTFLYLSIPMPTSYFYLQCVPSISLFYQATSFTHWSS